MTQVLFVCLGNICRSPSAEAVFTAKAKAARLDVLIDSAGTSGWHVGDPPFGPMIAAASARGYDLTPLRARQVSPEDFAHFDLIVAMDRENLTDLQAIQPRDARADLQLFTSFVPGLPEDVPDPYYTRDFDGTLDLIETAADGLIEAVARGQY